MTVHRAPGRHDFAMVVVSLIWGANFSITKYALLYVPVLPAAAVRFAVGAVLLYGIARRMAPGGCPTGRRFWQLIGLGVLGNTLYQWVFMTGLHLTTATNAALVVTATPTMVALFGAMLGIERATRQVRWGIVLGTLGVIVVIGAKGIEFSGATWTGDLILLGAVLAWALFTLGVRVVGHGVPPIWITAVATIGGAPGLILLALPQMGDVAWGALDPWVWGSLGYSTLLALVVAYTLWGRSIQGIGSNRVALYACVVPVIALAFAWLLLDEQPVLVQLPGAVLVIVGVLVSQGGLRELPMLRGFRGFKGLGGLQ